VSGGDRLDRPIRSAAIQKPGLVLTGLYEYFHSERLQVIGRSEVRYFSDMGPKAAEIAHRLCDPAAPAFLMVSGLEPPAALLERAAETGVPVLITPATAADVMELGTHYLAVRLAPRIQVHGTLVDLYGLGVLIIGDSGLGKSESALELVTRGHRLIADDAVEIHLVEDQLFGSAPELTRHLLEVRGIGIINVRDMFGVGAVGEDTQIGQVVRLFRLEPGVACERLGGDVRRWEILGVALPMVEIPVAPGRNLAVLLEIAARRQLLAHWGRDASRDLQAALLRRLSSASPSPGTP
jgi:HPr kinase/phosphorylase